MRLVRGVVAAGVGVVVLAGCSDAETANETLPSTTRSPAEISASLTPLGPPDLPMPAEAREQTAAGAEAFLRYYMDVYNAAQASMDPTYMKEFSQGCATCERISAEIESDASAGYAYQGGQVEVDYLDATQPNDARAEAVFSIRQAPLTVLDANGEPVADLTFEERVSPGCGAILGWSSDTISWVLNQWDIS